MPAPFRQAQLDTGLIFSLFDIASVQQVLFGILQYIQCRHHGLTFFLFMSYFFLLTAQGVDSQLHDGFPMFANGCIFHEIGLIAEEFLLLFFVFNAVSLDRAYSS